MSTMKLSQMVANALDTASQNVASARDAEKTAGLATRVGEKFMEHAPEMGNAAQRVGGMAASVGKHLGGKSTEQAVGRGLAAAGGLAAGGAAVGAAGAAASRDKKSSVLETAQDAVKFAESLESLAHLMPKIAGGSIQVNDANGPAISQTAGQGATKDTNTKATSLSPNEAGAQTSSGSGAPLDTNKSAADFAHAAASMMLDAKLAQAKALEMAGHHKTAAEMNLQAKAEFEKAKLAYTEAAPTPKGETKTVPTDFTIPGGVARDNAGMASMTKRDAKTQDVRASASKHISEPALSAASDKGLTDNLNNTSGAKIAGIFSKVAGRKQAYSAADSMGGFDSQGLSPEVRAQVNHRLSLALGGVSALGLGASGAMMGAGAGAKGALIGGALGAGVGGLGGYGLGRLQAHGQSEMDKQREDTRGLGTLNGKLVPMSDASSLAGLLDRKLLGANTIASPEEVAASKAKK